MSKKHLTIFVLLALLIMLAACGGTEAVVEPTETVVEPAEAVVEPAETVVEPAETVVEPTEAVVEPTKAIVESTIVPIEGIIISETSMRFWYDPETGESYGSMLEMVQARVAMTGTMESMWQDTETGEWGSIIEWDCTQSGHKDELIADILLLLSTSDDAIDYLIDGKTCIVEEVDEIEGNVVIWQWTENDRIIYSVKEIDGLGEQHAQLCRSESLIILNDSMTRFSYNNHRYELQESGIWLALDGSTISAAEVNELRGETFTQYDELASTCDKFDFEFIAYSYRISD